MIFEFYLDAWMWAKNKMTPKQFNKRIKRTGVREWTINLPPYVTK